GTTEPEAGREHANLPPVGGTLAHAVVQPRQLARKHGARQWVEFEAGAFTLPADNTTFNISSRLHNTDCTTSKGGLTFDCAELRLVPQGCAEQAACSKPQKVCHIA
ncbi:hypothetical protein DUNSADRAFT_17724, partial [Dunaliella salina]